MKKIYLDFNLIVYLLENKNHKLNEIIENLSSSSIFPYSPAHIEEVAVPYSKQQIDQKRVEEIFNFLSELSGDNEFLPADIGTLLLEENPKDCFTKVMESYSNNKMIEQNEEDFLKNLKATDPNGKISQEVSNYDETILSKPKYNNELRERFITDSHLNYLLESQGFNNSQLDFILTNIHKVHFQIKERLFELALNYLEIIRFKPEKTTKSRSRMHDCTHAIYASSADVLVTNDKKFYSKVKAVYNYLGITTEVLGLDDFMKYNQ